jgi:hypothetical protein
MPTAGSNYHAAAKLREAMAELRLLRHLVARVTTHHRQLQGQLEVLHGAQHLVLADGSTASVPKTKTLRKQRGEHLNVVMEGLHLVDKVLYNVPLRGDIVPRGSCLMNTRRSSATSTSQPWPKRG